MRKNAGILTAVAVVLAFFGMSNLPKSSPATSATSETEKGTKVPAKAREGRPLIFAPCEEIQKRFQPFLTDSPRKLWKLPDFCYVDEAGAKSPQLKAENVDFVIATAPNPISTHLPLSFDRIIEIIQQAAQDNNYSYDSSWLPWDEAKEYVRFPDQLAAQDTRQFQAEQPGLIIFRNPLTEPNYPGYKGGLAVFLVSELPTGGIDQEQFDNAIAWIDQLGGLSPDRPLKVLGPNFSGSLPSLYQALHVPQSPTFSGKFDISSGSVSSESSISWFNGKMRNEGLGSFVTAMEGDSLSIDRFCRYAALQKYDTNRVAVLSEDETAFGGGAEKKLEETSTGGGSEGAESNQGLTYLYYPRDIATLRSAYEQQAVFSPAKQPPSTNSASTTLRGDLSEPANSEHDSVRSYGGQLTPLAQESVLLAITDVLKSKQIEFVILRSTNSLDQIFLSQFLRRSLPESRIVIDGADLLFRRGAEGASLRGVMVLSTYPLLTWQQDWTSSPSRNGESYRIFGEDNAEGIYIAARGLFVDKGSDAPIRNNIPPTWARSPRSVDENKRPATWLTVIGHRQFWPVAVLNSYTLSDRGKNSDAPTSSTHDSRPITPLPVEFWILLILCIVWSILHLLWCLRGSISPLPSPFRLAYFAPVPRAQHSVLISMGSLLVAAVAAVVATASGLLTWDLGSCGEGIAVSFILVTVLLFACFACALNYRLPPLTDSAFTGRHSTRARLIATVASTILLVVFILIHWGFIRKLTTANRIPAFWRSVHMLSGVSPLLPQLLLIAGTYCWFWFALRGLALFGDDRPVLPKRVDLKSEDGTQIMPMFSQEFVGKPTEDAALPIGRLYLRFIAIFLLIVGTICSVVLRGPGLRTLGEQTFGIYIFLWLTLCIAVILADTSQCWSTWLRLRDLLAHLDRLPLRRTLYALQGLSWRSVWAMSGNVLAERYSLISRQLEAMRHLKNQINEWEPENLTDARNQAELLWKIHCCQGVQIKDLVKWYVELDGNSVTTVKPLSDVQEEIASIAAFAMGRILSPSWLIETDSLILDRSRKKPTETESHDGPVTSRKIPSHVVAAEEFFVLPYLGFIQNILGRIRTIVLGSLCLFVATTLAVSSYPFDPLPVVGGIFLVLFIVTGTTMIVIYAGMHRDATLSYITGTRPGELGVEFWRQLITFGIGPLLGLLTTLFPSITDFVVSWLQPGAQVIK